MSLTEYRHKRDFRKTPEPRGKPGRKHSHGLAFVIQKHAASRLHYDFRLEWDGTLKSWAVPKGPSLDPANKQLAIQVEDHPISYGDFEGIIPQGEYGGGTVMLWDRGTWEPVGDAGKGLESGKLKFLLHGDKLLGHWTLVRMHGRAGDDGKNWLLIKERDEQARPQDEYNVVEELDRSVTTHRSLEEIASAEDRVWSNNRAARHPTPVPSRSTRHRHEKATGRKPSKSVELDLAGLSGAKKGRMPTTLSPQLATLSDRAPGGPNWIHEMKFDGYRILAFIHKGNVELVTRNGNNWTRKFSHVAQTLARFPVDSAILDGEVVVLKADGTPDFQRLQNLLKSGEQSELVYYVFDLPYCQGYDLRRCGLLDRKQVLKAIIQPFSPDNGGVLRYSDHVKGDGPEVLKSACEHHLEGIVSKQSESSYSSTRSKSWLKTKCLERQEFVICGYLRPGGKRKGFSSLVLGYHNRQGKLIYCGRVGTGFTAESLKQLSALLKRKTVEESPFTDVPQDVKRKLAGWVKPDLVAEVEFTEWTSDGSLRHPSFKGLREDKPAEEIIREEPQMPESKPVRNRGSMANPESVSNDDPSEADAANSVAGIVLSHPDRIIYPEIGLTKTELANYYVDIADWILPHLIDRPLSLVRCPRGAGGQCFYQKHFDEELPEGLVQFPIHEKSKTENYVVIKSLPGLVWLVQIGVLEIHPWGSRMDDIEHPDRMIFDLDPGEGVTWKQIVQGAWDVKARLQDLGLESFLRTSGGKGLHICVPLTRRRGWEETKEFAHALATAMMRENPDHYIDTLNKQKRRGRIFVDYLRNGRGATAVASYSTRARQGAPVATPLRWDELHEDLKPNQYTVRNIRQRLASLKADPWTGYFELRQSITKAMLKKFAIH